MSNNHSLYFKEEFPDMYVPVPLRTQITVRVFWYEVLWATVKKLFKKKPKNDSKPKA